MLKSMAELKWLQNRLLKVGGHAVAQTVEALGYKPKVMGLITYVSLEFFTDTILPAALWPWV